MLESILIDQIPAYGYVQVPELNEVQPFFLPDEDDGEAPQNKKNTNKKKLICNTDHLLVVKKNIFISKFQPLVP